MFERIIRFFFLVFGIILSFIFLLNVYKWLNGYLTLNKPAGYSVIAVVSACIGALFYYLAGAAINYAGKVMKDVWAIVQGMALNELIFCTFGLLTGLTVANLLGNSISKLPLIGIPAEFAANILFGALGIHITFKKRDMSSERYAQPINNSYPDGIKRAKPKILDTSVIIDGRIVDICKTGFIEGPLVIPGIVLEELRHIADSSDNLKRNRGRRGLDVLNTIQKELNIPVEIYESKIEDEWEVDIKLLKIAQRLQGAVLTNDFNLNKVASVHRVPVLNINELANSLKPIVLPGEEMTVSVIKCGKENGQGIGYLDDGTMIVVEGGRRHMGEDLGVVVTSVLQTSAGRMIFAKPKCQISKAI